MFALYFKCLSYISDIGRIYRHICLIYWYLYLILGIFVLWGGGILGSATCVLGVCKLTEAGGKVRASPGRAAPMH